MSEENSFAVKETAHASASLERLANALQKGISRFRVA